MSEHQSYSDDEPDIKPEGGRLRKLGKVGIQNKQRKFFKNYEEDIDVQNFSENIQPEEEYLADEKLIFIKPEQILEPTEQAHKQFFEKALQYKQKVAVFEQIKPEKQNSESFSNNINVQISKQTTNQDFQLRKGQSFQQGPDQLEIQLFIPKVGAKNTIIDNTLYLNKMRQQGFNKFVQKQQINQFENKSQSRGNFQKVMKDKINERRSKNVNIDELMKRFQHTDYDQIYKEKQKNTQIESKPQDYQEDENTSQDEDVKSQDFENDDENSLSGQESEASQHCQESHQSQESKEKSQHELIIDDLKNLQHKSSQKSSNSNSSQEPSENSNSQSTSRSKFVIDVEEEQVKIQQTKQQQKLNQIIPTIKVKNFSDSEPEEQDIQEGEIQMFSKLRKLSQMLRVKRSKVLQEQELQKIKDQRIKDRLLQKKQFNQNFVEQEAEQGSDNEDHDDIVKPREYDDDEEEPDEVNTNLVGLIDDQIGELNDENEERAYKIFLQNLRQQEKVDIRKILRGEFKGRNKKKDLNVDILNNHDSEVGRLARMEEYIKILKDRDDGLDENDEDNDLIINARGVFNKLELRSEIKAEKICQTHLKMRNQIALIKGKQPSEMSFFNQNVLQKINVTQNHQIKNDNNIFNNLINGQQQKHKNSFLSRGKDQFSIFDQNLPEINGNSNSLSILNKKEKKHSKNFALNQLFAACQTNTNLNKEINKSPKKVMLFGQKRK